MKPKNSHVLIFFFLLAIPFTIYSNTANTLEYCKKQLALAQKEQNKGNYTNALEIALSINVIAEFNGWTYQQTISLNLSGIIYVKILDYNKAMDFFLKAYELAIDNSYKNMELTILNNIAVIYLRNNEIEKAKNYFEEAYPVALHLQDTSVIGGLAVNLGNVYHKMGELEQADNYLDIAISTFNYFRNNKLFILNANIEKAKILYSKQKYDDAEKLSKEILEEISGNMNDELKTESLLLLSKIYQQKKQLPNAILYAKQSLEKCSNLRARINVYEQLASLYKENNLLLVIQYKDSIIMAKDSLAEMNKIAQIVNNQIRFELLDLERKMIENQTKQKTEHLLLIWIIIFISILSVVLIWTLRIKTVRNKQRIIISNNHQQIIELELEKEKNKKMILEQQLKEQETLILLEQEQLNNEINEKLLYEQRLKEQNTLTLLEQERLKMELEAKNRQLIAKTLLQSDRNKLINDIVNDLSKIPESLENPILISIAKKLKKQLKKSTDLDNFLVNFREINPTLFSVLKKKHPKLTVSDIYLLFYIYTYLDIKKVAQLMNISVEACRKKKQRLAMKIDVKTSELNNYLLTLTNITVQ